MIKHISTLSETFGNKQILSLFFMNMMGAVTKKRKCKREKLAVSPAIKYSPLNLNHVHRYKISRPNNYIYNHHQGFDTNYQILAKASLTNSNSNFELTSCKDAGLGIISNSILRYKALCTDDEIDDENSTVSPIPSTSSTVVSSEMEQDHLDLSICSMLADLNLSIHSMMSTEETVNCGNTSCDEDINHHKMQYSYEKHHFIRSTSSKKCQHHNQEYSSPLSGFDIRKKLF
mmetsp:Transcript_24553/g.30192  ORF Transcript_24553/g.30192 Transcript_24553/m.30192 type:complete len:231 (-) Transcript_24553:294-986(-)